MKTDKTLDRVLIILALFLLSFIVAMIVIYTIKDWQMDTLITMVMGGSGVEVLATALITIFKYKNRREQTNDE